MSSNRSREGDSTRPNTPAAKAGTPPAPANTPIVPSSNPKGPKRAMPKGSIVPPTKPTPSPEGSLRGLRNLFRKPLPPSPLRTPAIEGLNEAPLAGRDKLTPRELQGVEWRSSPLQDAGKSPTVVTNPMNVTREPVRGPGLLQVMNEVFPPTPPTPRREAASAQQATPAQAPKALSTVQGALDELISILDETNKKYPTLITAPSSQALSTVSSLSSDNTVGTTLKALTDLIGEAEFRHKPAAAKTPIPKAPSRPGTPGASTMRAKMADEIDIKPHGDVSARITNSLRSRNPYAPNEGGQGLIRVVNVTPATKDALVPVRSKNFFGKLFGIYNNEWQTVNAANYAEILGIISKGSQALLQQSKNTKRNIIRLNSLVIATGIILVMVPELINMLQNNYSTDKTTAEIFIDFSLRVLLFTALFANIAIAFSGLRSEALHEFAEASAKTLERWGQVHLGIQLTEQELAEVRINHSKVR